MRKTNFKAPHQTRAIKAALAELPEVTVSTMTAFPDSKVQGPELELITRARVILLAAGYDVTETRHSPLGHFECYATPRATA